MPSHRTDMVWTCSTHSNLQHRLCQASNHLTGTTAYQQNLSNWSNLGEVHCPCHKSKVLLWMVQISVYQLRIQTTSVHNPAIKPVCFILMWPSSVFVILTPNTRHCHLPAPEANLAPLTLWPQFIDVSLICRPEENVINKSYSNNSITNKQSRSQFQDLHTNSQHGISQVLPKYMRTLV